MIVFVICFVLAVGLLSEVILEWEIVKSSPLFFVVSTIGWLLLCAGAASELPLL